MILKNLQRKLAMLMVMILVLSLVGNYPIVVKAAEAKEVTFTLTCSGDFIPGDAKLEITCKDSSDADVGEKHEIFVGFNHGDKSSDTVTFTTESSCEKVMVKIEPDGKNIFYNGDLDNSWGDWKTIAISDLESSYNFVLDCSVAPDSGGGPASDIPEDKWQWDEALNVYKYVIDSDEKASGINNIYVPTNKLLIIGKDYTVPGELNVGMFGTLQIDKDCKLSGTVKMDNLSKLILGNSTSATNFDRDKFKVKRTGDGTLYDFNIDEIDNTEFTLIGDNYICYDGPDCGFNFNSNGTIKIYDENGDLLETRGTIDYKVTTDDAVVTSGTLTDDWQEVNIKPENFKAGTVIEFKVHINSGYKLQSNGVRFPNNKNTISNEADEDDGDGTVTCSYTLTETPDQFLGLTVDFIKPEEEIKFAEFYWSYDADVTKSDDGWGKYIEHGTIEIVSVTKAGSPVTNGSLESPPYWSTGDSSIHREEKGIEWNEKVAYFEKGTTVVARLIPDRGYQLTSFRISNIPNTTRAVDGVNEYTFVINRPDFYHLSAIFSPVPDKVDSKASGITGGAVSFADDEIDNGSMALYVTNASPSLEEMSTFNEMAAEDGYKVDKCISLNSEQRFYKGLESASRSDCWVINKSELSSPAEISLDVSDLNGSEVEVLHNHNGKYEVIPATYSNGTISFKAQSFSDFAIVSKGDKPVIEEKKNDSNSSSSSGPSSTQEEAAEEIKVISDDIGMTPSGAPIRNWQDIENIFLSMPAIMTPLGASAPAKTPLVQMVLRGNKTVVPAEVFAALSKSSSMGLHLFLGNATALTFMNNKYTTLQGAVDVSCVTVINEAQRVNTISFNKYGKLGCLVYLHTLVPAGTKSVTVYFTGSDGVRIKYGTYTPLPTGHIGFQITELGRYDIVY